MVIKITVNLQRFHWKYPSDLILKGVKNQSLFLRNVNNIPMQLVHWPVTQRVICEWVNPTNLRLATVTNGETPPMSKVTSEINLVPNPIRVLSAKNQAAIAVPGFQNTEHVWKQTVAFQFPKHGAMHRVLPTHLLSHPFTHQPEEILHPPWENYSWDGNETPSSHPARSTRPRRLLPGQILIHSLTLGCT